MVSLHTHMLLIDLGQLLQLPSRPVHSVIAIVLFTFTGIISHCTRHLFLWGSVYNSYDPHVSCPRRFQFMIIYLCPRPMTRRTFVNE